MFVANAAPHVFAAHVFSVLPSLRASYAAMQLKANSWTLTRSLHFRKSRRAYFSVAAAAAAGDPADAAPADSNPIFTGPRPAIVLAGFYLEELPAVRLLLDAAGGHDITLIPCMPSLLDQPLQRVLAQGEPQWDAPMPSDWIQGGGWGRQRVVLLNDLAPMAANTIIAMLEASPAGAEGLCSLVMKEEDMGRQLGEVLGAATMAEQGEGLDVDGGQEDAMRFIAGEEALPPVEAAMGGSPTEVYAAAAAVGEVEDDAKGGGGDKDFDDLIDQIAKGLG